MRAATAALPVFLFTAPAASRNYRAGIDTHVLVPCVRGMIALYRQFATFCMMHSGRQ